MLLNQIMNQLHRGPAPLDFLLVLVLDLTVPAAERDLEAALVGRLQAFLLELGVARAGRAAVGG